jgi:hypothetical protein
VSRGSRSSEPLTPDAGTSFPADPLKSHTLMILGHPRRGRTTSLTSRALMGLKQIDSDPEAPR